MFLCLDSASLSELGRSLSCLPEKGLLKLLFVPETRTGLNLEAYEMLSKPPEMLGGDAFIVEPYSTDIYMVVTPLPSFEHIINEKSEFIV